MPHRTYRFGDVRIDPLARELARGNRLQALSPKVFDCLVYLIEHRDRAVGRDELISAVWGRLDVTDTLLGQTLLKARRAVGDAGSEQHAIRTVPRFGYRWIGELEEAPAAPSIEEARATPASVAAPLPPDEVPDDFAEAGNTTTATSLRTRRVLAAAGIGIATGLVVLGLLAVPGHRTQPPATRSPAAPVVSADATIVLPATIAATDEWSWLRLGMMDLVATRLRHAGLAVVPSDNVVAAVGAGKADVSAETAGAAARRAIGQQPLVAARITRAPRFWQVQLDWRDASGDRHERIEAQAADPIAATREATDRLLQRLGRAAASAEGAPGMTLSLAELQQRTEAALLADDPDTARRLIDAAPAPLRDAPSMRLRAGQADLRSGRFEAARTTLQALLAAAPAESEPMLRARTLYALGVVAVRQDRSEDAVHRFDEAITLSETRDEPGVLGRAYTGLSAAQVNLGRFDEAAGALSRARVALELAGDALALAAVDGNEGVLDNARGRPAEALPLLTRAAERFHRFGALNDEALTVAALVRARLSLLDNAAALADSQALWTQREHIASPRSRGSLVLQRARALAANGHLREARSLLDDLLHGLVPGEAGLPGDADSERARLALESGAAMEAIAPARAAVAALPTFDEAPERARAWFTLVRALRAAGQAQGAATEALHFGQWSSGYASLPPVALFATLARAEQSGAGGDAAAAARDYAAAFELAQRTAVPRDLATVVGAWGPVLLAAGDPDRASAVIGRVSGWAEQDFGCAVLQVRLYRALGRTEAARMALTRAHALAGERPLPADLAAGSH